MTAGAEPGAAVPDASTPDRPPEPAEPGPVLLAVVDAEGYLAAIPDLGALLVDAVASGGAVSFLHGLGQVRAEAWWRDRVAAVRDGTILPVVARNPDGGLAGCALVILSRNENSPHRAEIAKVLVHRAHRNRGIGRALMDLAERVALGEGRWLLVLDTMAGSAAESLYRSLGWVELGVMPNHALAPDGRLAPTTYFWKDLRPPAERAAAQRVAVEPRPGAGADG